jgi:hypothetical protein
MMKGRNNGKKLMAVRIVAHAFEIIHLLTDQNPIQVSFACHYEALIDNHNFGRFLSMPLSTQVPEKIQHVLVLREQCDVKLSMSPLSEG